MAENRTYYNYVDFIFDYFSEMGCHAGQGGYILRGLDERARNVGYNQEQIRIYRRTGKLTNYIKTVS